MFLKKYCGVSMIDLDIFQHYKEVVPNQKMVFFPILCVFVCNLCLKIVEKNPKMKRKR